MYPFFVSSAGGPHPAFVVVIDYYPATLYSLSSRYEVVEKKKFRAGSLLLAALYLLPPHKENPSSRLNLKNFLA